MASIDFQRTILEWTGKVDLSMSQTLIAGICGTPRTAMPTNKRKALPFVCAPRAKSERTQQKARTIPTTFLPLVKRPMVNNQQPCRQQFKRFCKIFQTCSKSLRFFHLKDGISMPYLWSKAHSQFASPPTVCSRASFNISKIALLPGWPKAGLDPQQAVGPLLSFSFQKRAENFDLLLITMALTPRLCLINFRSH